METRTTFKFYVTMDQDYFESFPWEKERLVTIIFDLNINDHGVFLRNGTEIVQHRTFLNLLDSLYAQHCLPSSN